MGAFAGRYWVLPAYSNSLTIIGLTITGLISPFDEYSSTATE